MTPQEIDRIECAIRHIKSSLDVDPWAVEIAVKAMKTQLSAEGTTSDLISRQAAIDVCDNAIDLWHGQLGEGIVIAVKKKIEELLPAQPEIEEQTEEFAQNVPKEDLISRKAAIEAMGKAQWAKERLMELTSAQPETKPISYQDCANAMMMMWMDDVLTDGEYRRIMDKLNDHESRRENR